MPADPPASPSADDLSFEGALQRLEEIVERLEGGDLPLEEALAVFEEGVGLSRRCAGELDAAEQRIEALVREAGGLRSRPFDAEPAAEGESEA